MEYPDKACPIPAARDTANWRRAGTPPIRQECRARSLGVLVSSRGSPFQLQFVEPVKPGADPYVASVIYRQAAGFGQNGMRRVVELVGLTVKVGDSFAGDVVRRQIPEPASRIFG